MTPSSPGRQAVRSLEPGRLVIASHNPGKVREIEALLRPFGMEAVAAATLDLPEPEETGTTFVANAELKARMAADLSGLPALSDDSGVVAEALGDLPGIDTALWALADFRPPVPGCEGLVHPTGQGRDFGFAMRRLEQALKTVKPEASRSARFVCTLCLAWPDGHTESWEGRVHGTLVWPPRGENGFGFDPMFVPDGATRTYGEMAPEDKHADDHRARAFRQLVRDAL